MKKIKDIVGTIVTIIVLYTIPAALLYLIFNDLIISVVLAVIIVHIAIIEEM